MACSLHCHPCLLRYVRSITVQARACSARLIFLMVSSLVSGPCQFLSALDVLIPRAQHTMVVRIPGYTTAAPTAQATVVVVMRWALHGWLVVCWWRVFIFLCLGYGLWLGTVSGFQCHTPLIFTSLPGPAWASNLRSTSAFGMCWPPMAPEWEMNVWKYQISSGWIS